MSDGNDLLMGGGGHPWAKWPDLGSTVGGEVVAPPTQRQSRDFDTGQPAEWSNGDPKLEVVVLVQTDENDPELEGDDGVRAIVLPTSTEKFKAVQRAVRAAGAKGIEAGGFLSVTFTHEVPNAKPRFNPVKHFSAEYRKPQAGRQAAALADSGVDQEAAAQLASFIAQ